jgi:hypothetical protein
MALSRSSSSVFQRWAIRAIAAFLVVYLLGAFGVPTLVPYLAVVVGVVIDGVRLVISGSHRGQGPSQAIRRQQSGDTIH